MKKVLIVGASGLIGQHLIAFGLNNHWTLSTFSTSQKKSRHPISTVQWNPNQIIQSKTVNTDLVAVLNDVDVVINLAGASVANGRLGKKAKQLVLQSRLEATAALVKLLGCCENKDKIWIQISGSSYYGSQKDRILTEESSAGSLFLSDVTQAWEGAIDPIRDSVDRMIIMRLGLVIAKDAPAFQKILLPITLGLGGPLASGKQYWPWIHIADVVQAINFVIDQPQSGGVYNLGSPNPETQLNFTKKVGTVWKRPVLWPNIPTWFLRIVAGHIIDELVAPSQRMIPKKLVDQGYRFKFDHLKEALEDIKKT